MKLLHVNIAHSGGGLEQYLAQLFEELNKRGHMSVFLYSENGHESLSLSQVKAFCVEGITQLH